MIEEPSQRQRRKGPAVARDLPRDEEILKIAAQVLWREGLRATVQEIAEAAGIHKASLYHYFTTKREILERILFWSAERMHPPLQAIREEETDPAVQLSRGLTEYIRFLLENPAEMGLLIFEAKRFDGELAATVAPYRDAYEAWFVEVLSAGMKQGVFRAGDPKIDMYLIFGMVNDLLYWYHPGGRLSAQAVTDYIISSAQALLRPGSSRKGDEASADRPLV